MTQNPQTPDLTITPCRSGEIEKKLEAGGFTRRIHRKGKRGKPLTEQAKKSNQTRSKSRVRVEHVFGAQTNDMGGAMVKTMGLARAKARIGMKTLPATSGDLTNCAASIRSRHEKGGLQARPVMSTSGKGQHPDPAT